MIIDVWGLGRVRSGEFRMYRSVTQEVSCLDTFFHYALHCFTSPLNFFQSNTPLSIFIKLICTPNEF